MAIMGSPSAFSAVGSAITAEPACDRPFQPLFDRIWPPALITFGLGLTAAWMGLLAYGLFSLVSLTF